MAENKPCFLCKFYQSTPYGESCTGFAYGTGPDDPFDNRLEPKPMMCPLKADEEQAIDAWNKRS